MLEQITSNLDHDCDSISVAYQKWLSDLWMDSISVASGTLLVKYEAVW